MRPAYNRLSNSLSRYFKTDMHFFLSGSFWLTTLQIITLTGGLVTSVIFTNMLSPSTYGTYKYIIGLSVLLSTFSLSGMTQAIQQATIKKYVGFFFFAMKKSLVFSLGIFFSALVISGYYLTKGDQSLAIGTALIAIFVPLAITFQNSTAFLIGGRKFKTLTVFRGANTFITTAILVTTLILTENVLILLFVYFLLQLAGNFAAYLLYKPKTIEPTPVEITKKYYAYAWHTTVRNFLFNIAFRMDNIIVFSHLGATDLAVYSIANILPEQIKSVFKNLTSLLLLRYAKHDDLSKIKKTLGKRSLQLFVLLLLITISYVALVPFVYHLLFPGYVASIFYSQLAALSFPAFTSIIPASALMGQLKEKELHYLNSVNSLSLLFLTIVLTYAYGLTGTILARVLYRYTSLVFTYFLISRLD